MDIDGAPDLAFKAGVEQTCGVLERSALGECQLHDALVRLAGADHSIMIPNRNASPLPFLDDFGVGLFDERADLGKRLAPPVVQFLDPRVDQPRRGFALGRCALSHVVCTSAQACMRQASFLHSTLNWSADFNPSAPIPAPASQRTAATRPWRPGRPAADPAGSPTVPCAGGFPCSSG